MWLTSENQFKDLINSLHAKVAIIWTGFYMIATLVFVNFNYSYSQLAFACSKLTIETLEKCVKYFQLIKTPERRH